MNDNPDLNAFYRVARIVLWVEDALTREYLSAVWDQDKDVHCYIAGGNEKISGLVGDARGMGLKHVFGVLDRDFSQSNRDRWDTPEVVSFKLVRHEIENYLLDPDALAGVPLNNRGRTRQQIAERLGELARLQPAWLACRSAVRHARSILLDDVPKPSLEIVRDIETARSYLRSATWLTDAPNRAGAVSPERLEPFLDAEYRRFEAAVGSDDLREVIDGKAVFSQLSDFVYRRPPKTHTTVANSDVAKAVGAWQRTNGRVPDDISGLLAVLKQRIR